MTWKAEQFRLAGGLNREDPIFTLTPGAAIVATNYEAKVGGGYRRVDGYERFDGRVAAPHLAAYSFMYINLGGSTIPVQGDLLTGQTSGATAIYVGIAYDDQTGSWAAGTFSGQAGITNITGTFAINENVKVGANYVFHIPIITGITTAVQAATLEDIQRKSWLLGAQDYYRSLIGAVPGEGAILGVSMYNNNVYAWRNNVGSTAAVMHIATTSGWTPVTLSSYLRYQTGTAEIAEGDTITGVTSGATAIVRLVNIAGGNYAGPTFASGRFAISNITGVFQNAENLQVGGVTKAVAVGTQTVATWSPSGKFETRVHNFYGASNRLRLYGCDGVNRAWEFTGTYFNFIETGMTVDTPNHTDAHRDNLFLSFPGGSLQNSSTGLPGVWSVRQGASEIGIGQDITNVFSNGNNSLLVSGRSSIQILFGTSDLDWTLKSLADSSIGGIPYTTAEVNGTTCIADPQSINLIQPNQFGNAYNPSPISRSIRTMLDTSDAVNAKFAIGLSKKSQYRIFFGDKTVLCCTFNGGKAVGWMPSAFPHQFVCGVADKNNSNIEAVYCGTDTGYVMQMDVGTNFDGSSVESVLQLPYNYHRAPDRDKRFRKISLDIDTPSAIDLRIITDFDYGYGGLSTTGEVSVPAPSGGVWDFASWDQFFWDAGLISNPEVNIAGVGKNIAITFYHNDAIDEAFTIQAVLLQFDIWGIRH